MSSGLNFNLPPQLGNYAQSAPTNFSLPSSNTAASPFLGNDQGQGNLVTIPTPLINIWGVFTLKNEQVFDVDTCVDVKFGQTAKISTFPVESGAFADYNVVLEAYEPKIKLAVGGQVRIQAFMNALKSIVGTTQLFNIITPEISYMNVALLKYDYVRAQKEGRNLLQAELTFIQVIEVAPQYATTTITSPKKPGSASKTAGGKGQTSAPPPLTTAQQNALLKKQAGNLLGSFTP